MNLKTGITIGVVLVVVALIITYITMSISVKDTANTKLAEIDGFKSKVEISHDNMKKQISQMADVPVGEKDAFLEFQAMVAESKKGQTLGGIMSQIQEKYPKFDIKGFDKLAKTIEIKRDEFALAQTQYNSRIVDYNAYIVKVVNDFFLDESHVKLEQFVVSSAESKEAMETGEDEVEKLTF